MRKASEEDSNVWLVRMVFSNHLTDGKDIFPPLNKICQSSGSGHTRGISVYNMAVCPTTEKAFQHAEQVRRETPIYAVGITVGECLEIGTEVWFNHGEGLGTHAYHAFIKTVGDKKSKATQREDIMTRFIANGQIGKRDKLPSSF